MSGAVERLWEEFRQKAVPEWRGVQLQGARRVFYAGFAAALTEITKTSEELEEDEACTFLSGVQAELEDFFLRQVPAGLA